MRPSVGMEIVWSALSLPIPKDELVGMSGDSEKLPDWSRRGSRVEGRELSRGRQFDEPSIWLLALDSRLSTLDDCFLTGVPNHLSCQEKAILCRMHEARGEVRTQDFLEGSHAILRLPLACDLPCEHLPRSKNHHTSRGWVLRSTRRIAEYTPNISGRNNACSSTRIDC